MRKTLALTLGLLLALSGAASAQIATGNIYASVNDESGAVLPGANATLEGPFGSRSVTSGADGALRFLGLGAGEYKVTVSLAGFTSVVRSVRVTTGENVNLAFGLKVSGVQETVTVTSETPLVDTKKRGTATTMTSEELKDMPNARDPWAVLKAVPGVFVDRANIAGNENGQQANSSSKGSTSGDQTWNLDGLVVTDMSATGSSPTYFDFGAFSEITVTTGGTDLTMQTGGSGVNLVTKRGSNAFHGSARGLLANHKLSFGNIKDQDQSPYKSGGSSSLSQDLRLRNPDGTFRDQADHIQQTSEYGFDLGGPIIKDKLWFYGTYGKQDIRIERLAGTPDKTLLPSYNAKLNWQATSKTMVSAFYFLGSKQKFGRSPGTGLQEEDGWLWNQDNAFTDGGLPGGLWKLQIDQTFSPNFFASLKGAYYDTGFGLVARGDFTKTGTLDYVSGIAKGTGQTYLAVRPQKNLTGDANYFFQGLGGNNELKFGFSYRDMKTTSSTTYSADGIYGAINAPTDKVAFLYRDYFIRYSGKYVDAYVGDMLTKDRFTLNVGARFDRQTAKNDQSEAIANKGFPSLMPSATYAGSDGNLQAWNTVSPRLGMSYALDEARKTVLRASYARYYQQLSFGDVAAENPTNFSYLAYEWNDANNDGFVQKGEVNLGNLLYYGGIDPANPSTVSTTTNKIDRDRKPKHDDEFILGLDRELGGNFAVGAAVTYRMASDWGANPRLAGACTGDPTASTCPLIGAGSYTQNAPTTANGFTAFTYSPNSALVAAGKSGRLTTNRADYKTKYNGLELTLNKRLSNKWMSRIAFTYANWTHNSTAVGANGNPTSLQNDSLVDGDSVALLSGGSGKGNIFYTSYKWQIYANALYQLPWGLDISGAAWGRQGSIQPIYLRLSSGSDGSLNALATPTSDSQRFNNLWDFDARLAKSFKFGKQASFTLAGEWYNVANSGVVLDIQRQANTSSYHRINEVLSPSIFRVSATFSF